MLLPYFMDYHSSSNTQTLLQFLCVIYPQDELVFDLEAVSLREITAPSTLGLKEEDCWLH